MTIKHLLLTALMLNTTSMMFAMENDTIDAIFAMETKRQQRIEQQQKNEEKFLKAALYGNLKKTKECLKNGVDINTQDKCNRTALHRVCIIPPRPIPDHLKTASELLKHKINPNIKNTWGKTAAHYAAERCNCELLYLIKEHGGDLNKKDNFGKQPLDEARESYNYYNDYSNKIENNISRYSDSYSYYSYQERKAHCAATIAFLEKEAQK